MSGKLYEITGKCVDVPLITMHAIGLPGANDRVKDLRKAGYRFIKVMLVVRAPKKEQCELVLS
jgi:hypothetical protein